MNSIEFIAVDAMIQDCIIKHVHDTQTATNEAEHYILCAEKMKAYLSIKDCIEKALEQVSFNKSKTIINRILNNSKVSNERVRRIVERTIRDTIDIVRQEAIQTLIGRKKEINIKLKKQLLEADETDIDDAEDEVDDFDNKWLDEEDEEDEDVEDDEE